MELNYFREFTVLAETENFLDASEALFISQSTLSKHIKAIESELGVQLFERTTRRVRLNENGRIFLQYARQIASIQYQYTSEFNSRSEKERHRLPIGSIPVLGSYHITEAIVQFKKDNKNMYVELTEGDSDALKVLLRQNKCELAFIRSSPDEKDEEFAKIPYTTDSLVAVLPKDHILAGKESLTWTELKNEDLLLLRPESMVYQLCKKCCLEAGFEPNIIYTGKRAENIIDLVEKGMGISLLMKKPIQHLANSRVILVDIKPTVSSNIEIYYKKDAALSVAAKHFISSIQLTH